LVFWIEQLDARLAEQPAKGDTQAAGSSTPSTARCGP